MEEEWMKSKSVETEFEKGKKPFYRRKWFIVVVIIAVIVVVLKMSGNKDDGNSQKIEWSNLELGNKLPKPTTTVGEIYDDTDEGLRVNLEKVSKGGYKKYIKACEKKGYTVDADKSSYSYDAYNSEGYKLSVTNIGDQMSITLEAPMTLTDITWPTSAVASMLPVPKSTKGKFSNESDSGFSVYIGDTSPEDYAAYVQECSDKGFNVDYNKDEKYYNADNAEGYHIDIKYEGNNIMEISISSPDDKNVTGSSETQNNETVAESNDSDNSGLGTEFKNAMDSYEAFINEYVDFLIQYNNNPSDITLINEYQEYLTKYNTFADDFAKWEGKSLNQAEAEYYVEVQTRVTDKLAEVAK